MRTRVAAIALSLLSLQSCYTLARGFKHECHITSDPPGARFTVGDQTGITPAKVMLKRRLTGTRNFFCELDGYTPAEHIATPQRLPDPNFGVFMCGFIDGLLIFPGIVDLTNGTTHDWPHFVHFDLAKAAPGSLSRVQVSYDGPITEPQDPPGQ